MESDELGYFETLEEGPINAKALMEEFSFVFDALKNEEDYKQRLTTILDGIRRSPIAMITMQLDGTVFWANEAAASLMGYPRDEFIGIKMMFERSSYHSRDFYDQIENALQSKHEWQGELWHRKRDGTLYLQWTWAFIEKDADGESLYYHALCIDITKKSTMLELVNHSIYRDFLTGLPTKHRLLLDVEQLVNTKQPVAENTHFVVLLEIDRFFDINIAHGYNVGDQAVLYISRKLFEYIRPSDGIYLLERGLFAILVRDYEYHKLLQNLIDLREHFRKPIALDQTHIQLTFRYGVSACDDDIIAAEDLLRNAELALREAATIGTDYPQFYSNTMAKEAREWHEIREDLHNPAVFEQLEVYYQPIVNSAEVVIGAEALLRWNHPRKGIVGPSKFIRHAEQSGFIIPMGYWIMEEVFKCMRQQQERGMKPLKHSINLSVRQVKEYDFIDNVMSLCELYGIEPQYVTFEITESQAMSNVEELKFAFDMLRFSGFGVALDDFGTGYSSLSVINDYNLTTIKIDKSFITGAYASKKRSLLVASLSSMVRSLGLTIVSEGVETEEDMRFVKRNKFNFIQGYFISKPLRKEDYFKFITGWEHSSVTLRTPDVKE